VDNNILLAFLRDLARKLRDNSAENLDDTVETLQMAQDHLAIIYAEYEKEEAPPGAELLRELMMEALQLMFLGIDEFFHYLEDQDDARLTEGLSLAEEGNDIMSSIKHSVENNQEWTSSASLG
jgi:transcriptional regulator of heat shock response